MAAQYQVKITETAEEHLKQVRSDRGRIKQKIVSLKCDPDKRGQQLSGDLSHLYSIRAGQYRIVYRIVDSVSVVFIKAVGLRKEDSRSDIYRRASRLFGK